jgi:hypothetical protein
MTAWFARVGLPLAPEEDAAIGELTRIVAPHASVAVTAIASWQEAAAFVRAVEHDATWWDQEEEEREALWARAAEHRTESELLQYVDAMTGGLEAEVRGAAFAAATAAGGTDTNIAVEATGMALLAAHQCALAGMAGEGPNHRFVRKYALFTSGRWPLGYHSARFVVF